MRSLPKIASSYFLSLTASIIALFVALTPVAEAKHRDAKASEQTAQVIAHVVLPGSPANQMLLQDRDGKEYLYLVRNSGKGFTVVDVTKPSQPNLLKRVVWPDGASAGGLQLVSGTLGLAEGSDSRAASMRAGSASESVELLDLSDPGNPRTVEKFSGVTSVLTDEGRHLIFITNMDGLWILQGPPPKWVSYPCQSEDATASMPSCQ